MTEVIKAQKPLSKSTKLVLVVGASFPSMQPPMPPLLEPISAPEGCEDREGQWFHIIPSKLEPGVYPHTKKLCVSHQVVVGTIDEIVELYRYQIEAAVDKLLMLKDLPKDASNDDKEHQALTWINHEKMQRVLAPAVEASKLEGKAIVLPWITGDNPAYTAWEQAKITVAKHVTEVGARAFNMELLRQLKSEDKEEAKRAIDSIHSFMAETVCEARLKLADDGVFQVNDETEGLSFRMFGIDTNEDDFRGPVDVRTTWRKRLGIEE